MYIQIFASKRFLVDAAFTWKHETFLRISRVRNIPVTRILARVFVYLPLFMSQIQAVNY